MYKSASGAGANSIPRGHRTLHLTPAEVWNAQRHLNEYRPEAFESDGFIHCTDDALELIQVGNRYYRADRRQYLALTINCDLLRVPVLYEDAARIFPHIYGPLAMPAAERLQVVIRNPDGEFIGLETGPRRAE